MIIEKITNIDDALECNKLLNKLIISEKKFNNNIDPNFIVKDWFEKYYKKVKRGI